MQIPDWLKVLVNQVSRFQNLGCEPQGISKMKHQKSKAAYGGARVQMILCVVAESKLVEYELTDPNLPNPNSSGQTH